MASMIMNGSSNLEVGRKFRLTTRAVKKEMAFATKEGLLQKIEEEIINDLYPLAMKVMKKQLEEQLKRKNMTNHDAAKAILKEPMKRAAEKTSTPTEMTLEEWVIQRKALPAQPEQIVEGQIAAVNGPDGSAPGIHGTNHPGEGRVLHSENGDKRENDNSDGSLGGSGKSEPSAKG